MSRLDFSEDYRKYRNLNQEYLALIERIKGNRADSYKIVKERKELENSIWEAEAILVNAHEVEDARLREVAVADAQEGLEKAEEAIRKMNRRYDAIREELGELKGELTALLNRVRHDREASRKIDAALLERFRKERRIKERNRDEAADFRLKLGLVQENLMGGPGRSAQDEEIHREYDATMTTITSLTDMIDYYQELEAKLRLDVVTEEEMAGEGEEPPERKKTEEEMRADAARADEYLEQEIRPRRIERAKSRDKLQEIISTQARKVDLDPRDMEGIHSVEEMQTRREELLAEIAQMEKELEEFDKVTRNLARRVAMTGKGGVIGYLLAGAKARPKQDEGQEDGLKEPDDTEEERFVYRYKIVQREMNRRYNEMMGKKDTLTEDAYADEEEEE